MNGPDLIRSWKDPATRDAAPGGHPAGEIRLRTAPLISRRIGILAGAITAGAIITVALDETSTTSSSPFTTTILTW